MIEKITKIPQKYYEAIGPLDGFLGEADIYRFKRVKAFLYGTSVLDVACGQAGFLKIIKKDYTIAGTEINRERVGHCNRVLQRDAVKLGNLDAGLDFEDDSFDTVTCLEVLEHLLEPRKALEELLRISRKRVIVTVPYNQNIQYELCLHCAKYTPHSGHLHSFDKTSIRTIVPPGADIVRLKLCANKLLKMFPSFDRYIFKAPSFITSTLDGALNRIFPKATWMMVVIDKNKCADNPR